MKKKIFFLIILVITLLFFVSYCSFLKKITGVEEENITISGIITVDQGVQVTGQIYVGFLELVPSLPITSVIWSDKVNGNPQLRPSGQQVSFEFTSVPKGRYIVLAFIDSNGNGIYNQDEPLGAYPIGQSGPYLKDFQSDFTDVAITIYPPGVSNRPPTAPVLNSPANGSVDVSLTPTLSWNASTDPDLNPITYDIYLDTNSDPIIKVTSNVTKTSFTLISALDESTKYAWKVAAKDGKGGETMSGIWYFTTGSVSIVNHAPNVPSLSTPYNIATSISIIPTLSWLESTDQDGDPVNYDIYLDINSNPVTKIGENLTSVNYALTLSQALDPSITYYWQVVAKDDKGGISESLIWSFTTVSSSLGQITQPSITNIGRGMVLSDWNDGTKLTYIWINTSGNLYSIQSSDAGTTWGTQKTISTSGVIGDFAADMDGSANTIILWAENVYKEPSIPGSAYYSKKAFGDTYGWDAPTFITENTNVALPSVFKASSTKIVFGVGTDTIDGADGGNALSLYWDGTNLSGPFTVGLSGQTDNVVSHQIWADSSGNMYYIYNDNHFGWEWDSGDHGVESGVSFNNWGSTDDIEIVDGNSGSGGDTNADQGYLFKGANGEFVVVYAATVGGSWKPFFKHSTSINGLVNATPNLISSGDWNVRTGDGNLYLYHTMYAIQDPAGNIHVVWTDPSEGIRRAKIKTSNYNVILTMTAIGAGYINGISYNFVNSIPKLIISTRNYLVTIPNIIIVDSP